MAGFALVSKGWGDTALTYVSLPVIPKRDALGIELTVTGVPVKFSELATHELRSVWK